MTKKISAIIIMIGLVLIICTGCKTNKSYTFDVDTGDKIKITIDTTDGYSMNSDLPFKITLDDETQSQGTFIYLDEYEQYKTAVVDYGVATVLDKGTEDGNEYIFYTTEGESGTEYDYIIKIKDSDTAVVIGNKISEKSAKNAFKALTFSKE